MSKEFLFGEVVTVYYERISLWRQEAIISGMRGFRFWLNVSWKTATFYLFIFLFIYRNCHMTNGYVIVGSSAHKSQKGRQLCFVPQCT